jgi:hypothetical protein
MGRVMQRHQKIQKRLFLDCKKKEGEMGKKVGEFRSLPRSFHNITLIQPSEIEFTIYSHQTNKQITWETVHFSI